MLDVLLGGISELLAMLALLSLAIFIVWDSYQLHGKKSEPMSRERRAKGFIPGQGAADIGWLAFAACMILMGIERWQTPEHPPFEGRGAWLWTLIYVSLGPRGFAVTCWAFAATLVAVVAASRLANRHEKQ